jgi:hypothetical protein
MPAMRRRCMIVPIAGEVRVDGPPNSRHIVKPDEFCTYTSKRMMRRLRRRCCDVLPRLHGGNPRLERRRPCLPDASASRS